MKKRMSRIWLCIALLAAAYLVGYSFAQKVVRPTGCPDANCSTAPEEVNLRLLNNDNDNDNDRNDEQTMDNLLTTEAFTTDVMKAESVTEGNATIPSVPVLAAKKIMFKIGVGIQQYYLPVAIILGLVGNTLSMLVMMQRHNRRISCCVYMGALAVTDNLVLVNVAYFQVVASSLRSRGVWTAPMYDLECKTISYLTMVFSSTGVFLIIAMTVDRFLAVRFPLKAPRWCTVRRAKITGLLTIAVMAVYNSPYLVYTKVIGNGKMCAGMVVKTSFSKAFTWINIAINSIVPFMALMTLNIFIINTIRNRRKKFPGREVKEAGSKTGEGDSKDKDSSRERNLTVMLMLVSFTLLALTMPMYMRFTVYAFVDTMASVDTYAIYMFMWNLTSKLFFTNNCCNFLLYCMGGTKFRQDLAALFPCCRPVKASDQFQGRSTASSSTNVSVMSGKAGE